jgi:thioredoxin-like negative regulator of GroEL
LLANATTASSHRVELQPPAANLCTNSLDETPSLHLYAGNKAQEISSRTQRDIAIAFNMAKINKISSSGEFQKLLSANTTVITDFYADWCGPCKAIAPIFEQLATSHAQPGKVAFAKVNVDEQADIAQKYGVSA